MSFKMISYDELNFGGHLAGMETWYMNGTAPASYKPAKAYEQRFFAGQPARTMDVVYDALKMYKGTYKPATGFVAETTAGIISEMTKDGETVTSLLLSKKKNGDYFVKGNEIDGDDISTGIVLKDGDKEQKLLLMFSILPLLLKDAEAQEIYDTMSDFLEWDEDAEDWLYNDHVSEFAQLLNRFSCNVQMQLEGGNKTITMDLSKVGMLKANEMQGLSLIQTFVGGARRFSFAGGKKVKAGSAASDLEKKYQFDETRVFSKTEQDLTPHLQAHYIMPEFVEEICQYFKATTSFPSPMRTAYLVGPAGTGKTEASRAIAALCGLPIDHITCNPQTEIFDFLGQVMFRDKKVDMDDVRKSMGLPSTEDIINDPKGSYPLVYGKDAPAIVDEGEIIHDMVSRVMEECSKQGGSGLTYIESGLIKAVRNGWCFEIQEIGCVLRPGVAVGLNALLESGENNYITLPTGDVVKKHPDTVIIFTSNDEYEGCCNLNQSVLDRMSLVYRIENPPKTVMKERIMARLNFPNEKVLERMIDVIYDISEASHQRGIEDGVCGYRALENWAMAVMVKSMKDGAITDAICYQTAIQTVMNKASQKKEYVDELMSSLTYQFAAPNNI